MKPIEQYKKLNAERPTLMTLVKSVTAILFLFGMLFKAYGFMDTKHAQASDIEEVRIELAMTQKQMKRDILYDQASDLRKEIRELEKDLKTMTDERAKDYIEEEIEKLKEERSEIKKRIENIMESIDE